jgi:hypothetical protein
MGRWSEVDQFGEVFSNQAREVIDDRRIDGWASTNSTKCSGHPRESVDGRWGEEGDDATSSSMCHATSTSMCHATSPKLTPQDDVSCHISTHVSCHISQHIKWSMVDGQVDRFGKCFRQSSGITIING